MQFIHAHVLMLQNRHGIKASTRERERERERDVGILFYIVILKCADDKGESRRRSILPRYGRSAASSRAESVFSFL